MTDETANKIWNDIHEDMDTLGNKLTMYGETVAFATFCTMIQAVCESRHIDVAQFTFDIYSELSSKEDEING